MECWLQVLLSCHCFCFHCTVHINYSWHQDYFMTSKQENLHVNQYIQRLEAKTPRPNSGWWEEHTISALFSFFYCNVIKKKNLSYIYFNKTCMFKCNEIWLTQNSLDIVTILINFMQPSFHIDKCISTCYIIYYNNSMCSSVISDYMP